MSDSDAQIPDTFESAELREIDKNENEETPVLDVHVPHATHTWKDFLIHIATITIGLLIAVSLEQTVEWIHHLHERHQLEEDLREEGLKNRGFIEEDFRFLDLAMQLTLAEKAYVDGLRSSHVRTLPMSKQFATLSVEFPTYHRIRPLSAAWTRAEQSQLIRLLPRAEAESYGRVYTTLLDYLAGRSLLSIEAIDRVDDFCAGFADRRSLGASDSMHMSAEHLEQFSARMSEEQLGQFSALLGGVFQPG